MVRPSTKRLMGKMAKVYKQGIDRLTDAEMRELVHASAREQP
jgi:hypothetical protein